MYYAGGIKKRRKGIDKNVLKQYKGECMHAGLGCHYMVKETERCECKSKDVEEINDNLEKQNLLIRKKSKYYYNDII